MKYSAESIYGLIANNGIPDGIHTYHCSKNNIELDFELVTYSTPVIMSSNTDLYLGNSTPDTQMLILKFESDLTIESGCTLTPPVRKKGFVIWCNGTLTNNGTISMSARGASAAGQDLYLYEDEFVPATGGAPGARIWYDIWGNSTATSGNSGTGRQTGAGGSGGGGSTSSSIGAYGTSYSGGSGGGGVLRGNNSAAHDGKPNGGAGGNGYVYSSFYTCSCGGGAGNPGGSPHNYNTSAGWGGTGTGGLLILFSKELINNGTISSNGSAGGWGYRCGGGGSGGGSINIFATTLSKKGTIVASGGARGNATRGGGEKVNGGAGGNGTVTIMEVEMPRVSSDFRANSNFYKNIIPELTHEYYEQIKEYIHQKDHGFKIGDPIFNDGIYKKATINNTISVIGIVSEIIDENTFVYKSSGKISMDKRFALPGDILYLAKDGLTSKPESIAKPVGIQLSDGIIIKILQAINNWEVE